MQLGCWLQLGQTDVRTASVAHSIWTKMGPISTAAAQVQTAAMTAQVQSILGLRSSVLVGVIVLECVLLGNGDVTFC